MKKDIKKVGVRKEKVRRDNEQQILRCFMFHVSAFFFSDDSILTITRHISDEIESIEQFAFLLMQNAKATYCVSFLLHFTVT